MGGKYSTELASATDFQKERFGVFSLRGKQKQSLIILEQLLEELLASDNKIFSLVQAIKEDNCKQLFIVLSSSLKKEFQVMKFPDPSRPSEPAEIAYIPTETYSKSLVTDDKRKTICKNISWFMVRLITLLFALISSVKFDYSKGISILKSKQKNTPKIGFGSNIFDEKILRDENIYFTERGKFIFFGSEKVLIDKDQGIVFTTDKPTTGIARIMVEKEGLVGRPGIPGPMGQYPQAGPMGQYPQAGPIGQYQQAGPMGQYQQAGPMGQYQQAGPMGQYSQADPHHTSVVVTLFPCLIKQGQCIGAPSSSTPSAAAGTAAPTASPAAAAPQAASLVKSGNNLSSVALSSATASSVPRTVIFQQSGSGRKTRRFRKHMRKTYKYRGVGGNNYVLPLKFILRQDGMTKLIGEYGFTMSFSDRVSKFLDSINDDEKFKPEQNPFIPLDGVSSEVLARIKLIYEALRVKNISEQQTTGDVYSPAQFRAFLLATQSRSLTPTQTQLLTSFCEDSWRSQTVTDVLSYAMFDALFKDLPDNSMSPINKAEYTNILNQFVSNNIMKQKSDSKGVETLNDLVFSQLPDELLKFCGLTEKAVDNTLYIELLMNAHKQMRNMYDQHIQAVIDFITSKVISPKARGFKQVEWTLNPIFSTDSRGANIVLESLIKEARMMLAKHYFAVESLYTTTINQMKTIGLGIKPVKNVILATSSGPESVSPTGSSTTL